MVNQKPEKQPSSDIKNGHIKVSDLASWYWCAEECYLRCNGMEREITELDREGNKTHKAVVRKPIFPWEKEFFKKLKKFHPFYRKIENVKIFAGFDAIDSTDLKDKIVRIVEHKTRGKPNVPPFLIPRAEFQLQIYCWIFEPIIRKIGFKMADIHHLSFTHRDTLREIKRIRYSIDYNEVERKIKECIIAIKQNKNIIPPKPWKCKNCAKEFKIKCRFNQNQGLNRFLNNNHGGCL